MTITKIYDSVGMPIGIELKDNNLDTIKRYYIGQTVHTEEFGDVKFALTVDKRNIAVRFLNHPNHLVDVVLDIDFNMHIEDYYENLLPGIHANLEFMDYDNDTDDEIVMVDDLCSDFFGTLKEASEELCFVGWPDDDSNCDNDEWDD